MHLLSTKSDHWNPWLILSMAEVANQQHTTCHFLCIYSISWMCCSTWFWPSPGLLRLFHWPTWSAESPLNYLHHTSGLVAPFLGFVLCTCRHGVLNQLVQVTLHVPLRTCSCATCGMHAAGWPSLVYGKFQSDRQVFSNPYLEIPGVESGTFCVQSRSSARKGFHSFIAQEFCVRFLLQQRKPVLWSGALHHLAPGRERGGIRSSEGHNYSSLAWICLGYTSQMEAVTDANFLGALEV